MNLLDLKPETRDPFSKTVQTLIQKHKMDPNEIFMNVLESQEAPEMNYWMMKVLIQEHFVSPQQEVAKDAEGVSVKPLQAACLLGNVGALAALLEANAFQGEVTGREFQLAARIASKQEDQALLGVIMKYAQETGSLELLMRELQSVPMQ
uniref:Ankyrin repeat domain-containing protein n=1 Tax=Hydrogenovibrio crunogenus (strain DSM 25203 / XCL-2) TaxID=317025 RepID=Q31JD9_HYDCU